MQFVDVKTDIAFKKIFGSEQHKEILIGFLNALLELEGNTRIKDVTLRTLGSRPTSRFLKKRFLISKLWTYPCGCPGFAVISAVIA
jgi:hypothetical protein